MKKTIGFVLNKNQIEVEVESHWMLLQLLRDVLELSGTKPGCGEGECGACTVLVNDKAINACIYPVMEIADATVTTIEGMAEPSGKLHPIQQAFIERGAIQCGFCTPGMIMASRALLDESPNPREDEIRHALAGNLCRCTGYTQIIEAVEAARESLHKG